MIELAHATTTSTATPGAYFARWVDHESWSQWSPDTEWVRITGPIGPGSRGVLKPKGGPKTRFVVSAYEADHRYEDTSRMPGARLVFDHRAVRDGTQTTLTVAVHLDGPLQRLWSALLKKKFAVSVPADLERLRALVELEA